MSETRTSVERIGDQVIIRMSIEDVQSLRVALCPCPCKSTKSNSTTRIRERLERALGRTLFPKKRVG